jgi:hypothetical protein
MKSWSKFVTFNQSDRRISFLGMGSEYVVCVLLLKINLTFLRFLCKPALVVMRNAFVALIFLFAAALTDKKVIALLMDMKSQMHVLSQQQQLILRSVGAAGRANMTATIPNGIVLPMQTFEQVETVEKKLRRSSADTEQLVTEFD